MTIDTVAIFATFHTSCKTLTVEFHAFGVSTIAKFIPIASLYMHLINIFLNLNQIFSLFESTQSLSLQAGKLCFITLTIRFDRKGLNFDYFLYFNQLTLSFYIPSLNSSIFCLNSYGFAQYFSFYKCLIQIRQQKYKPPQMRNTDSSLSQSQPFLPLESSISPEPQSTILKNPKKHKPIKGKTILFDQLKKVPSTSTEQKRQCIIKYLKKEELPQDLCKVISTIQQEGHAIPMLQVAVALSRYDNQFLKQLLNSKTIEVKQNQESQIYQLNKKLQSDPILSLLSDSQQLKKLPKQHGEPSFIDFKHISPSRKNQLIDVEKGKLKKSKSKYIPNIEFPHQLTELKKQLMSLPYINRYKQQLSLKKHYKQKKQKSLNPQISVFSSRYSGIKSVSDLNNSKTSFKNKFKHSQNINQLEETLKKVIDRRNKSFQISAKDISLPPIQKLDRFRLNKSLMQIRDENLSSIQKLQNQSAIEEQNLRQTGKSSEQNPQDYKSSKRNSQRRKPTIFRTDDKKFWPQYHNFSSYNNKKYLTQVDKLTNKIRSLTELSEVPSQQTLDVYYSLKRLQKNDLKKLEQQAFDMEKKFTNTKYKIKYKNLKDSYSKRLKDFTKDKKMRQFQLQESAYQEQKNLIINQVKINNKILEKMTSPKKDSK